MSGSGEHQCPDCGEKYETERGLAIHRGHKHPLIASRERLDEDRRKADDQEGGEDA